VVASKCETGAIGVIDGDYNLTKTKILQKPKAKFLSNQGYEHRYKTRQQQHLMNKGVLRKQSNDRFVVVVVVAAVVACCLFVCEPLACHGRSVGFFSQKHRAEGWVGGWVRLSFVHLEPAGTGTGALALALGFGIWAHWACCMCFCILGISMLLSCFYRGVGFLPRPKRTRHTPEIRRTNGAWACTAPLHLHLHLAPCYMLRARTCHCHACIIYYSPPAQQWQSKAPLAFMLVDPPCAFAHVLFSVGVSRVRVRCSCSYSSPSSLSSFSLLALPCPCPWPLPVGW
jgi:hypothetical protein